MAKTNLRSAGLASTTLYKVFVTNSTTGNVVPPSYNQITGTPVDGTIAANGDGVVRTVQWTRLTAAVAGVVSIYDIKAVGEIAATALVWTKTVAVGDIYTPDMPMVNGLYVVTDGTAKVWLGCQ